MLGEAKEAGRLISVLGFWGEGADFNMTETEEAEGVDGICLLIESGGEPHRVREGETRKRNRI